jgi:hypothetical protein
MTDSKIWEDIEPPKGTIYNYPARPWHDAEYDIIGSSGPPEIAVRMWNRAKFLAWSLVSCLASPSRHNWAKDELERFAR